MKKRVVPAQLQPQRQLLPHPRRRLRQPEGGGELREAVLPAALRSPSPSPSPAADETQRPVDRRLSVGEPGIRTGSSLGAAAGPARYIIYTLYIKEACLSVCSDLERKLLDGFQPYLEILF